MVSIVIAKMLPAFCIVQYVEIQWCILSDKVKSRYNKNKYDISSKKVMPMVEHRLDYELPW